MAKSFCANCAHWEWKTPNGKNYLHYCSLFQTDDIAKRKEQCNGEYKKKMI